MDNKSFDKIKRLLSAEPSGNSPEEVFARCYKACEKTLSITPFDEQLKGAIALFGGKMVQMQTGEGKTLCAVFAACAHAISEKGRVHILTFNDYLARRDCLWMKPVYDEMNVSVGFITEETPRDERKALYQNQVLYITAKEAGFDYLRDFLCFETDKMCFPELHFAIFDEADSILIDEARIPLVIAGNVAVNDDGSTAEVYEKIKTFDKNDYEFDEESRNVYLTDAGADKAEAVFKKDVYAASNAALFAKLTACLKAREYLKEDKDYIVKDGRIVLIDEFTGRAAEGRVFPGELQPACEAKHGLKITSRGRIMGSIPLQYFARLYPKIAGMTGTAESAREQFEKFYGMNVEIIPTRLPCKRTDGALELYFDKAAKRRAILTAIKQAHEKKRPVLVGTESIEESESIAKDLEKMSVSCNVLNAKNNAEEAAIIARAGERGAVTISTNMAGRGVDIKLGGEDFSDKEYVESVGGLLVIITSMRESSRITRQLRGRAGRQGDVGESRFFSSLDDEIMIKYDLKSLCARRYPKERTEEAITEKTVLREAERVQRISEGDSFDEWSNLMKYTLIGEKHRSLTFSKRSALLDGEYTCEMWQKNAPELYEKAVKKFGEDKLRPLQNTLLAALLNEFHSDYLDYASYLREGIHLTQIAGRNPAEEYNIACEEYYESAAETIPDRMTEKLSELLRYDSLDDYHIEIPTKIYTYLLNDLAEEFKAKPILLNVFSDDPADYEDDSPKEDKKGFFGKLFGKKQ